MRLLKAPQRAVRMSGMRLHDGAGGERGGDQRPHNSGSGALHGSPRSNRRASGLASQFWLSFPWREGPYTTWPVPFRPSLATYSGTRKVR